MLLVSIGSTGSVVTVAYFVVFDMWLRGRLDGCLRSCSIDSAGDECGSCVSRESLICAGLVLGAAVVVGALAFLCRVCGVVKRRHRGAAAAVESDHDVVLVPSFSGSVPSIFILGPLATILGNITT